MNTPDPLYNPLIPTVDDLLDYQDLLDWEDNHISFEWADHEARNHSFGFVRVGLVAEKIKRYKLYLKGGFESFQDYCEKRLGRLHWQVNQLIRSAKIVLQLVRAGFKTLPQNESQAKHLLKLEGDDLLDKWEEVVSNAPPHRITAAHVEAVVRGEMGGDCQQSRQFKVPVNTYSQLAEKAAAVGLKPAELLAKLVDEYDPPLPVEEEEEAIAEVEEEEEAIAPVTPEQLTTWVQDVQALLLERHGCQVEIRRPGEEKFNEGVP